VPKFNIGSATALTDQELGTGRS